MSKVADNVMYFLWYGLRFPIGREDKLTTTVQRMLIWLLTIGICVKRRIAFWLYAGTNVDYEVFGFDITLRWWKGIWIPKEIFWWILAISGIIFLGNLLPNMIKGYSAWIADPRGYEEPNFESEPVSTALFYVGWFIFDLVLALPLLR